MVFWEQGKSRPQGKNKEALVALRKLGRRDVKKLLAEKGAGAKQAAKKKARTKVKKKVVGRGTRKRATKKQKECLGRSEHPRPGCS